MSSAYRAELSSKKAPARKSSAEVDMNTAAAPEVAPEEAVPTDSELVAGVAVPMEVETSVAGIEAEAPVVATSGDKEEDMTDANIA